MGAAPSVLLRPLGTGSGFLMKGIRSLHIYTPYAEQSSVTSPEPNRTVKRTVSVEWKLLSASNASFGNNGYITMSFRAALETCPLTPSCTMAQTLCHGPRPHALIATPFLFLSPAEEDAQSEVWEWQVRERREREEVRRLEAVELGAEERSRISGGAPFVLSLVISLVRLFPWYALLLSGQAWVEYKGELATSHLQTVKQRSTTIAITITITTTTIIMVGMRVQAKE